MTKKPPMWITIIAILVVLAFVFVVDDVTGIGELVDPIEFLVMAGLGYYLPKTLR
jgi:hypothetical protein